MGNAIADKIAEYGIRIEKALNRISGYVDPEDGGSVTGLIEKDVNFYDYDGTLLYAYTTDEFLALEDLPAGPNHSDRGWRFFGWSIGRNIDDVKDAIYNIGSAQVGAIYNSPSMTITFESTEENDSTMTLNFSANIDNGVVIDWGDGTPTETYTQGNNFRTHPYVNPGKYTITLSPNVDAGADNVIVTLGNSDDSFFGKSGNALPGPNDLETTVTEIVVGSICGSIQPGAFRNLPRLKTVMIAQGVQAVDDKAFLNDYVLKAIVIPPSVDELGAYLTHNCFSLQQFIAPEIEMNFSEVNSSSES